MRVVMLLALCVLLAGGAPPTAAAAAVRVPGEQPTIQAGIDVASAGDTILVAPGTYTGPGNRDLDVGGKDLVILSEAGSAGTTIDCEGNASDPHRGLYIPGDSPVALRLDGFEIRNGYADGDGGGMCVVGADLTLIDCAVRDCDACTDWSRGTCHGGGGGGVYCQDSTITAEDCVFSFNSAGRSGVGGDGAGGGICLNGCAASFTRCQVIGNGSSGSAGGVYAAGNAPSGLVFTSCVFDWNHAGVGGNPGNGGSFFGVGTFRDVTFTRSTASRDRGGAVYGGGVFENVTFTSNSSNFGGGALYATSDVTMQGALFASNETHYSGAAVSCTGGTFENVLIYDNLAFFGAGAIRCLGDASFQNITIVDNQGDSGALAVECLGSPTFTRTVIAFHDAWVDEQVVVCGPSATPQFHCCNIYGNENGDWVACIADQCGVSHNFSADPQFCDTSGRNFHVFGSSPCAPEHSPCGELIGALGVGCEDTSVEPSSWGQIKALYRPR